MVNKIKIHFSAKEQIPEFIEAAKEYQNIWDADGEKIVAALTKWSGLAWKEDKIEAKTFEGISHSHPLELRSSRTFEVKKATLVHELGHRLLSSHNLRHLDGQDSHQVLDLFLYDVWVELYGKDFADEMVKFESNLKGVSDYEGMWKDALAKTQGERQEILRQIIRKQD